MIVGTIEAQNKLGHLLDPVGADEDVTITRHGKAVARQVSMLLSVNRRRPGGAPAYRHAAVRNSTRRFLDRLSSVVFGTSGRVSP